MMDMRRMSNWNALSVEAALQQLNGPQDIIEVEKTIRKSNTVSLLIIEIYIYIYINFYILTFFR
jgi:hypothetical protein